MLPSGSTKIPTAKGGSAGSAPTPPARSTRSSTRRPTPRSSTDRCVPVGDVYCNNCGHKNPIGSNFCSSCGAILETDSPENTTITFHPTSPVDPVGQGDAGDDLADEEDVPVELTELPADLGVLVVK